MAVGCERVESWYVKVCHVLGGGKFVDSIGNFIQSLVAVFMKFLLIYISTLFLSMAVMAQADTLLITITPFTKKDTKAEILYVAINIKSTIPDSIEIDDSRGWIRCAKAIGVKLVTETLEDNCFKIAVQSDCHPIYNSSGDFYEGMIKNVKLGGFDTHSYVVELFPVYSLDNPGTSRVIRNFNPYRFKLELPYKIGNHMGKVVSRNWAYFAYPR